MPATARKKIKQTRRSIKRRAMTASEKMRAYRARMRAKGFKLVQNWVPNINDPAFIARVQRDIAAVRNTPGEREAIEFLDTLAADMNEWT